MKRSKRCGAALALAVVVFTASTAGASDSEKRFAIKGVGVAKCASFVQAYDERSSDGFLFAGWLTGFITALNQQLPDTFDLAPWQSTDVLMLLMRDLCGQKPDDQFYKIAGGLIGLLGRDRLQALSEPVEMANKDHKTALPKDVVRRVQERLKALDLYKGGIDGSYGSGMQKAIEAYQKQQKLPETGIPDQQTLVRLMYQPGKQ
jgi:hypothetical protein